MPAAKEKPILFSGPMVRSILDGRKTQTRRPIKPQPEKFDTPPFWRWKSSTFCKLGYFVLASGDCPGPFGLWEVDDLLWVREKARLGGMGGMGGKTERVDIIYAEPFRDRSCVKSFSRSEWRPYSSFESWTPSIHMPRWASRITLRVKRVWIERAQDISEEDARSEGMSPLGPVGNVPVALDMGVCRYQFANLWEDTYPGSWDANQWVWACEFERVPSAT